MRTVHKTTAIVAALGIAFGVTACGTDTKSVDVARSTPKASATTTTPTTMPPTPTTKSTSPAPTPKATTSVTPLSVDGSLKMDLKNMATEQETWLTDHIGPNHVVYGVAVAATKPGGTAKIGNSTFHASRGNVIAVKVYTKGYCISGYNKTATKAYSATKSFLYKSDKGGLQAAVGACSQVGMLARVDASLQSDLKKMATLQETWITNNPTSLGVEVSATKPGGTATVETRNDFHASAGNVIAVHVTNPGGYCISGYNKSATKATSARKSLVYKSEKGGIQAGVGAC